MLNVINAAKLRIETFCEVNNINLNEEILCTPIYEIKDFFRGRNQSGNNFSEKEAREDDLKDSIAFFLPLDDLTGKPAILYDYDRMKNLKSFEDMVQIIIHEYLHYKDATGTSIKYDPEQNPKEAIYDYDQNQEAAIETISYVILRYPEADLEDALDSLSETIKSDLLVATFEDDLGSRILKNIYTFTRKDFLRTLI